MTKPSPDEFCAFTTAQSATNSTIQNISHTTTVMGYTHSSFLPSATSSNQLTSGMLPNQASQQNVVVDNATSHSVILPPLNTIVTFAHQSSVTVGADGVHSDQFPSFTVGAGGVHSGPLLSSNPLSYGVVARNLSHQGSCSSLTTGSYAGAIPSTSTDPSRAIDLSKKVSKRSLPFEGTSGPSTSRSDLPPLNADGLSCVICGDHSTGRHYGVISCEGCKGFFKRTIRRQLDFTCRGSGHCPMDKQKRTRCQHCRLKKCLAKGMVKEAVQEERQRHSMSTSDRATAVNMTVNSQVGSNEHPWSAANGPATTSEGTSTIAAQGNLSPTSTSTLEWCLMDLLSAELILGTVETKGFVCEQEFKDMESAGLDPYIVTTHSIEQQLPLLVQWARRLPAFSSPHLTTDDRMNLLKAAWPDMLLLGVCFRSISITSGLLLGNGWYMSAALACNHGLGSLLSRINTELISRFRKMAIDRTEFAFIKAIILFNPDNLDTPGQSHVDAVRNTLYPGLNSYCKTVHPKDASRFTKLMLRLSPLRAIALKCLEHILFIKFIAEEPYSQRLINLIQSGVWPSVDDSPPDIPVSNIHDEEENNE